MSATADEVMEQVQDIMRFCMKKEQSQLRRTNMDEYKQLCMRTYTSFFETYPTLFFTLIENPSSFPMYRLRELLAFKKKVEEGELKSEDADVILGQKYFDEFAGRGNFK